MHSTKRKDTERPEAMLTDETIARLRAKSLSKPVPTPTAADRAAYMRQLRALGASDDQLVRLGLPPAPPHRRWWRRRRSL